MTSFSTTSIVIIGVLAFLLVLSLLFNIYIAIKFYKKNKKLKTNTTKQTKIISTNNNVVDSNLLPTIYINPLVNHNNNLLPVSVSSNNQNMQLSTTVKNVNNSNYLPSQYATHQNFNLLDHHQNTSNELVVSNNNHSSLHVKRNVNYKPKQSSKYANKGKVKF